MDTAFIGAAAIQRIYVHSNTTNQTRIRIRNQSIVAPPRARARRRRARAPTKVPRIPTSPYDTLHVATPHTSNTRIHENTPFLALNDTPHPHRASACGFFTTSNELLIISST